MFPINATNDPPGLKKHSYLFDQFPKHSKKSSITGLVVNLANRQRVEKVTTIMLSNSCHFSKEELISISTKELNKILQEKGISKKIRQIIKEERRTLKNRRYVSQ